MDPWTQIDSAPVPGSDAELTLLQREDDFAIRISDVQGDLMNSRMYHSEEVLAQLGCTRLGTIENARVLVAIWSVRADHLFTGRLKKTGLKVQPHTVRARPGKGSRHTIFVAQRPR